MLTRPLLRGTLALTAAGIYSRLTGSVSRIILVRLVGETGIGLFQMVVPVVNLAITLGMLGLPGAMAQMVAEAEARGDRAAVASHVRTATLLTGAVGALASLAFAAAPGPIGIVLFGETDAAPLLALLAVAAPFTYLQQGLGAALTGLGLTALELRNYAAGLAVRTLLLLALTGNPALGIRGAVLALAGGQCVMLLLHARALRRALA